MKKPAEMTAKTKDVNSTPFVTSASAPTPRNAKSPFGTMCWVSQMAQAAAERQHHQGRGDRYTHICSSAFFDGSSETHRHRSCNGGQVANQRQRGVANPNLDSPENACGRHHLRCPDFAGQLVNRPGQVGLSLLERQKQFCAGSCIVVRVLQMCCTCGPDADDRVQGALIQCKLRGSFSSLVFDLAISLLHFLGET
ncbi:hypothetical protein [Pseudomonas sp. XWY-1]|uniref:hypothetical protein n=1 Tax=Pseudomonas sp. XWY-1 TaxID=2069256 RepID=UPI001319EBFF|nr:hypothetical protein [Pseudomonas sp. XWY-1]